MACDSIIEAKGVKYRYPDGTVGVERADFELLRGEKVAIIGPNGSGKTTLLELLGGLLEPTGGYVRFFGMDSVDQYDLRKRIGILLQNPDNVLFNATVREDLEFGPRQLEVNEGEIDKLTEGVSKLLGLDDHLDKPPFKLSEGQKQKAALGSVLAMKPEVLLLDEPFSAIDLETRRSLVNHLEELNKEGITIVVTAHDLSVVPVIAKRVYLLNRRIVAEGSTREILTSAELLRDNDLEAPPLVELCKRLDLNPVALTIEEAVQKIREKLDKD